MDSQEPNPSGPAPTGSNRAIQTELFIGARMRTRRRQIGLSQAELAERLGVSFQQVQKYERGANRIGASRLFDLSRVLDVPVSFFFDDMSDDISGWSGKSPPAVTTTRMCSARSPGPVRSRCWRRSTPSPIRTRARRCWRWPAS